MRTGFYVFHVAANFYRPLQYSIERNLHLVKIRATNLNFEELFSLLYYESFAHVDVGSTMTVTWLVDVGSSKPVKLIVGWIRSWEEISIHRVEKSINPQQLCFRWFKSDSHVRDSRDIHRHRLQSRLNLKLIESPFQSILLKNIMFSVEPNRWMDALKKTLDSTL